MTKPLPANADEFVEVACLCYDDPHYDHRTFHARAHEMLRENPWLSEVNIWCAAAAGDTGAVRAFLDEQPELVNHPGPHGWAPVICACYSRVKSVNPAHSTFDVAKLLLEREADPNACTMKGNADGRFSEKPRRFTPLDSSEAVRPASRINLLIRAGASWPNCCSRTERIRRTNRRYRSIRMPAWRCCSGAA